MSLFRPDQPRQPSPAEHSETKPSSFTREEMFDKARAFIAEFGGSKDHREEIIDNEIRVAEECQEGHIRGGGSSYCQLCANGWTEQDVKYYEEALRELPSSPQVVEQVVSVAESTIGSQEQLSTDQELRRPTHEQLDEKAKNFMETHGAFEDSYELSDATDAMEMSFERSNEDFPGWTSADLDYYIKKLYEIYRGNE